MQFKYDTIRKPSAPIIELEIEDDFGARRLEVGMLDTGADTTVIPLRLVKELDLHKSNQIGVENADGRIITVRLYLVHIIIGDTKFGPMNVVALNTDCILVGRDLINLWTLELDGKNRRGKIDIWSNKPHDAYG